MQRSIPPNNIEKDASASSLPEELFTALYADLRRLAKRQIARHNREVTLGPTTLIHQTYIDIAGREQSSFPDEARFLGYAARVMRGLIIDHVRSRRTQKRGAGFQLVSLSLELGGIDERELGLVSDALDELAKADPELAELVDLKFFCGFSFVEIAAMRGVSERTVQRNWATARVYLLRSLRPETEAPLSPDTLDRR